MTDRELLELAALAAGYDFNRQFFDSDVGILVWEPPINYESMDWNPLSSDSDAFRLAVRIGIKIMPYPIYSEEKHSVIASRVFIAPPENDDATYVGPEIVENYNADHYAATRRAIVRAAAEIGRSMKATKE